MFVAHVVLCLTTLLTCSHVEYIQATLLSDSLSIAPAKVCATEKLHHTQDKRNAKVTASAVVDPPFDCVCAM